MNKTVSDLLKQVEANANTIRDKLLSEADERYQRKRDDLQREYAAERQSILNAFGMDIPTPD
jgi:F0F1-type ATP synthase membrane subunit b/b'